MNKKWQSLRKTIRKIQKCVWDMMLRPQRGLGDPRYSPQVFTTADAFIRLIFWWFFIVFATSEFRISEAPLWKALISWLERIFEHVQFFWITSVQDLWIPLLFISPGVALFCWRIVRRSTPLRRVSRSMLSNVNFRKKCGFREIFLTDAWKSKKNSLLTCKTQKSPAAR